MEPAEGKVARYIDDPQCPALCEIAGGRPFFAVDPGQNTLLYAATPAALEPKARAKAALRKLTYKLTYVAVLGLTL